MFSLLPDPPDPALRQPFTPAAVVPLYLSFYALGVLAMLPNTFVLKLSLLPFIVWQAWCCAVGLDLSIWLAQSVGHPNGDRLRFWNMSFVISMFFIALRSLEWTFIKKPLRKYELIEGQDAPVERQLSIPNVLLAAVDLFCNQRGIGWSWSPNHFPRESGPPLSIASVWATLLLKLTALDTSLYIIQSLCPSTNDPGGGTLFDPSLPPFPRIARAALSAVCGGVWSYTLVDSMYHIATLIGRVLLRQPASQWPRLTHRPWLSTSIRDFWSIRWHQFFRHFFVVFGARPGGALFGLPGAVMGAFTMSGLIHYLGLWGVGYGTEFTTSGGFFLLMGLGVIIEDVFKRATGLPVQGWLGWSWTMSWTLVWGTLLLDGWARHGILASDFFPDRLRPGKLLVDSAISLLNR
ncbi:hypothetical protein F5148DRAFT_1016608 [Russula earlei]|uniref:Uncharacterized protein n=1 Tax=Russula earlei TaxID=71964 RepID=A0ACC0U2Y9_9AGAM|nr:hypothetical protein F5148DRAFT_1016608 [Russula earlei]